MARKLNLDTSERLDITCKRGDSFSMQITLKDSSGNGLNLVTNRYEFVMQVRTTGSQRKISKSGDDAILSTSAGLAKGENTQSFEIKDMDDNGNLTIYASPETMKTVLPGRYTYELQYKFIDGEALTTQKTVLRGSFVINNDITE